MRVLSEFFDTVLSANVPITFSQNFGQFGNENETQNVRTKRLFFHFPMESAFYITIETIELTVNLEQVQISHDAAVNYSPVINLFHGWSVNAKLSIDLLHCTVLAFEILRIDLPFKYRPLLFVNFLCFDSFLHQ